MTPLEFKTALRAERDRHGLTLEKMAYLVGTPTRTYWDWEKGRCKASPMMMEGLIAMLKKFPSVQPKSK